MTTAVERPAKRYRVVGTRPIRHDGLEKVTGRARYGADVLPAGVLYGAVLQQPARPRPRVTDRYFSG